MTRTNYRVLAYYENEMYNTEMYNTESYIMIINARSEEELDSYMTCTDMYYEVLDEAQCCNIRDIKLAESIIIDGTNIYRDSEPYDKLIDLLSMIY